MAELRVESSAAATAAPRPLPVDEPPSFGGPTDDLVYFLSFAVAERYGATHDLAGIARILRERGGPELLRPLLTFAEDNPGDAEDRGDMDAIWQEAAPLAESAAWVAAEIRGSRVLQQLAAGFPALLPRLDDLARIAAWSAERGARVRLLFRL